MRRRLLLGYMSLGILGVKLVTDRFEKSSAQEIKSLPQGWQVIKIGNKKQLQKQFLFTDFIQAFGFMTEMAIALEKFVNYSMPYPEIFNVYNRVAITLSVAKSDQISLKTIKLAELINRIVSKNHREE